MKQKKPIIFTILLIFLIVGLIIAYNSYTQKVKEYESIIIEFENYKKINEINSKKNIEDLNLSKQELLQLQNQLLEKNIEIKNYTKTVFFQENKISELSYDKNNLLKNYDTIKTEIGDYQTSIQESMNWFKENSILNKNNYVQKYTYYENLKNMCINTKEGNICKIKIKCIDFVNFQIGNLKYLNDEYTSNKNDKLQSIQQLVDNKGGDCEDYSLLYKAEFNELIQLCEERKPGSKIELEIPTFGTESTEYLATYLQSDRYWFYSGLSPLFFSDYRYPVVICGSMPDPINGTAGHCMMSFTKEKINNSDPSSIEKLLGSPIIEPQNGLYMGKIGENYELRDLKIPLYLARSNLKLNSENYIVIFIIITDEDIMSYNFVKNQWESNSIFNNNLDLIKKNIIENKLSI